MTEGLIVDQAEFDDLCAHIRKAGLVAFDTEFVSEFTYRPELCLLQFATRQRCVAVDPYEVPRLDAWWDIMADEKTEILIHGGREEVRFCLSHTGKPPGKLWDVQIAEGMRGRSFPLGYEALVKRVIGKTAHGRETRSDWRRRPLTERQIAYALDDVRHMPEIYEKQRKSLKDLKRLDWVACEFQRFIEEVQAERSPDSWQRLSGLHRLKPRELAVAREIYRWREAEAEAKNRPARKILRDDLIIELARRQPDSAEDLLAIRDMNRTEYKKAAPAILKHIQAGLSVPDQELPVLPKPSEDDKAHDEHVLGQLLGLALANRCAELNVAVPLVGKSADLRQLVRWHVYGERSGEPPRLMQGWRAEVCGDLLSDVLDGKIALRVSDPQSDHPLTFERRRMRDAVSDGAKKEAQP
jgi:ribonuclease D